MTDKPVWMDYADLVAKILVPITVVGATVMYNAAESHRSRRQQCLDNQFKLVELTCHGDSCGKQTSASDLLPVGSLTKKLCDEVNEPMDARIATDATAKLSASGDAAGASQLEEIFKGDVAGAPHPSPASTSTSAPSPTPTPAPSPTASPAAPAMAPRLYIHFGAADRREDVQALKAKIDKLVVDRRPLIGVIVTSVTSVADTSTLRCFRAADCAYAGTLAGELAAIVGQPIKSLDLSVRYAKSTVIRPGHYELWLLPGTVPVAR